MPIFLDGFDREHTIPTKLKEVPYVYTSGSTSAEVVRYFVLPDDMEVEIPSWTKSGKPSKRKMTAAEFFRLPPEEQTIHVKISGVRDFSVNRVAPKLSDRFAELLLSSVIAAHDSYPEQLPQMRLKYRVVKQYTNAELDEMEKSLD